LEDGQLDDDDEDVWREIGLSLIKALMVELGQVLLKTAKYPHERNGWTEWAFLKLFQIAPADAMEQVVNASDELIAKAVVRADGKHDLYDEWIAKVFGSWTASDFRSAHLTKGSSLATALLIKAIQRRFPDCLQVGSALFKGMVEAMVTQRVEWMPKAIKSVSTMPFVNLRTITELFAALQTGPLVGV